MSFTLCFVLPGSSTSYLACDWAGEGDYYKETYCSVSTYTQPLHPLYLHIATHTHMHHTQTLDHLMILENWIRVEFQTQLVQRPGFTSAYPLIRVVQQTKRILVKVKLVQALCLGLGGAELFAVPWGHRSCCLYLAGECWNFRCALHEKRVLEVSNPH